MMRINFKSAVIAVFMLVIIVTPGYAQKSMKVVKSHQVISIQGKKPYKYYSLDEKNVTTVSVNGPGVLTIHTRVLLKEDKEKSLPFKVKYLLDKRKLTVKSFDELAKAPTFSHEGKPVSVAKEITIEVPPGKHQYSFHKKDTEEAVCVLFSYKKGPDPKWIDAVPVNKLEELSLVSVDKKIPLKYYRISDKMSFKVMVNPGDQLRLLLRPEFKHDEYSNTKIRIVVKQKGKVVNTYSIRGKRSEKVVYQNELKLIPGTNSEIYIKIPKPKDMQKQAEKLEYEIGLLDAQKTALIRFSVNQPLIPAVKKEETKTRNKK